MRNLIFTCDIFRIENGASNRLINPQAKNLNSIYGLWHSFIKAAYKPDLIKKICGDEQGLSSIRSKFLKEYNLPLESESWAYIFEGKNFYNEIKNLLYPYFSDSFVVGFELPPYMKKIFEETFITYVDVKISPIRFLNDYMFEFSSNDKEIMSRISSLKVGDNILKSYAACETGRSIRIFPLTRIREKSAVFFGQTEIDRSLIYEGGFVSPEEVIDYLRNLTLEHERVYFKHHPYSKTKEKMNDLVAGIPRVEILDANAYAILGHDNVEHVSSISSGICAEAKFFDIDHISTIIPNSCDTSGINILGEFFHPNFWHFIFGNIDNIDTNDSNYLRSGSLLKRFISMSWAK